jgi:glycosyltransferase involved in cell wall biosynthesis
MNKIAIVHEWFTTPGGSEKVVEQILQVFPDADLFSLIDFLPEKERGMLSGKKVHTSILQNAPFINGRNYRSYLAFMPLAIEQLDLSGYDLVISSSHAVSKGVITGPGQLHVSYVHTPIRYAWDMQNSYLENSGIKGFKGAAARILLHYIRIWDVIAASRPDVMAANSRFIARRIRKIYRREAEVIYPPVDTEYFTPEGNREDFYFTASRFVPYKRIDLIVEAFRNLPDKKLVIIGDGPELSHLQPMFTGNIIWLGYQPDQVLRDHLRRCKAFVFAAKEDFGIMPVEAQACGAPVIAFGEGGAAETVIGPGSDQQTGVFFPSQTVADLQHAIREFESQNIKTEACRENAERFSPACFQKEFYGFVKKSWDEFQNEN